MTRAGAIGLGGKALEFATLVPLVTVVPRALGPSDYGLFALGASIVALGASAAALGGPTLASRYIAGAALENRVGIARAIVRRSAIPRLVAAAAVAIAAALLTFPDSAPAAAIGVVVLALALDVLATLLLQAALPLGGLVAWSLRYPVQNVVLAVSALALYGEGGTAVLIALPIASASGLVLALATSLPRLRRAQTAESLPRGVRRFAVIQGTSGLLLLLLHRGPILVVALVGTSQAEVGFVGIAVSIATALTYAVWQVYAMELPGLVRGGQREAAEHAIRRMTRVGLTILVPATVLASLLAQPVVPRLLGPAYEGAATPVAIALAIVPLAPAAGALNQVTALRLTPEHRLVAAIVGGLSFVVVAAATVWAWNAIGASVALVAGAAAYAVAGSIVCPDVVRPGETACAVASASAVIGLALVLTLAGVS